MTRCCTYFDNLRPLKSLKLKDSGSPTGYHTLVPNQVLPNEVLLN